MKVIVFGGSGFLGSYVVDELIDRGHEVINADINPPIYNAESQTYKNVDILDIKTIQDVITSDIEVVYNFAGLADINVAIKKPIETVQLNIVGNTNILEVCSQQKVKRFVYASSAYAFSNKGTFYGISKQASEKMIEEYYTRRGLEFTILRYGSLYGERADKHNGIYRLLTQAFENKKIVHKGSGKEVREYIHCRDAAKLSVDILVDSYMNKHMVLTGLEKYEFKEILTMMKELLNDEIEIECDKSEYKGHYKVTPYTFHPTIGEKLVANPYVDLGQGLLECIAKIYEDINHPNKDKNWIVQ